MITIISYYGNEKKKKKKKKKKTGKAVGEWTAQGCDHRHFRLTPDSSQST